MLTFKDIREQGRLLYEYTRGSQLFGLDTPESDLDTGGVFIGPRSWFLGLGLEAIDNIKSEKNDDSWDELKKYVWQLSKSSPEVLESLFVPDELVLYKNPVMDKLLSHRDEFLTKACFQPFANYALKQIKKSRGQNKAMMIDPKTVERRKTPLEFCYLHIGKGSTWTLEKWLRENKLSERYCGLVRLPNFFEGFALFYDWGNARENGEDIEESYRVFHDGLSVPENLEPIGYRGILSPSDPDTTQLRLSSIPKGEIALCDFQFGMNAFSQHCSDYKRYHNWVRDRNPERFNLNKGYDFDCYLDDETEFLTNSGWKKFDEVLDTDLIGCFGKNHFVEYKPILSRTDKLYNGNIHTYESRYIRFSVTPNHNLYLSPCSRKLSNNFSSDYDESNSDWNLIPAEKYFSGRKSHFHQLNNLENKNSDNIEYSDDFISLLGLFLSEGSFSYDPRNGKLIGIRISQLESGRSCNIIRNIKTIEIKEYKYNYPDRHDREEITWECKDTDIVNKLLECNGRYSLEKDIPGYVYSFSKRQFDILLDSLISGDGTTHKKKGHSIYYTYSKNLAKSLNSLLRLNGYNSQLYGGEDGYKYNHKSAYKRKDGKINGSYQIFISKYKDKCSVIRKNNKKDSCGWTTRVVTGERIVCFETEYGTLITRNKNKLSFHGNSKNMCHCIRLVTQAIEIAEGKGLILNRRGIDRDFLLDVKNHKIQYSEIMEYTESLEKKMHEAFEKSKLPDSPDLDLLEKIILEIRKETGL